jgi:hypothetical protein
MRSCISRRPWRKVPQSGERELIPTVRCLALPCVPGRIDPLLSIRPGPLDQSLRNLAESAPLGERPTLHSIAPPYRRQSAEQCQSLDERPKRLLVGRANIFSGLRRLAA